MPAPRPRQCPVTPGGASILGFPRADPGRYRVCPWKPQNRRTSPGVHQTPFPSTVGERLWAPRVLAGHPLFLWAACLRAPRPYICGPRSRQGEQDTGTGVARAVSQLFFFGSGWHGRGAGMSCSPRNPVARGVCL
eukprot:gene19611-biopygen20539